MKESSVSGLLLSSHVGFCGDLRLYTVPGRILTQKTRVKLFSIKLYPFLGSCEAATGSFLYVLGNQSFGLKVYVDLKENNKSLFHIKSQKLKYM